MRRHREQTLGLLAIAALMASCGAGEDPPSIRPGTTILLGQAGSAGTITSGKPAGSVENPADSLVPLLPIAPAASPEDDAGTEAAAPPAPPLTSDNSCAKGKAEAKLEPVNMFVMIDRSGSMNDDNKWIDATAALLTFFRDPKAAGMRVALRFFPHEVPVAGCTDIACDPLACSQPRVALGELSSEYGEMDPQERALVLGIANSNPGKDETGGTPIHPALDGALQWAAGYRASHPYEKIVVVFATDGEPNGCNENFDEIALLAANALQAYGVTTYAIGFEGSNAAQLDQLAIAGGTTQGIFVDPGPTAEQALVTALNGIRGQTLACDFAMPVPTDATMTIDPARINVTFTPSAGQPGTLSQVPDPSACSTRKSWYYDTPGKPTRIYLCPAACELVGADRTSTLEVLLGCATACGGLDMSCGGEPPPPEVPPILF